MSVTEQTREELENELHHVTAAMKHNREAHERLLTQRNEIMRLLVEREELKLSEVAKMAEVTPSAVAFALGKYVRSGRRRD